MLRNHEIDWWFWLVTVLLLGAALFLASYPIMCGTIAFCALQGVYYLVRDKSIMAFPVQVRMAYTLLLVLALLPSLQIIAWLQLIGTFVVVTSGYCILARMMVLMPWNRSVPMSVALLRQTFLRPPVNGSIMQS